MNILASAYGDFDKMSVYCAALLSSCEQKLCLLTFTVKQILSWHWSSCQPVSSTEAESCRKCHNGVSKDGSSIGSCFQTGKFHAAGFNFFFTQWEGSSGIFPVVPWTGICFAPYFFLLCPFDNKLRQWLRTYVAEWQWLSGLFSVPILTLQYADESLTPRHSVGGLPETALHSMVLMLQLG